MLILLSPAKSLDYTTPVPLELPHTLPQFPQQTRELIGLLQRLTPAEVGELMNLSEPLAALNVARYTAWRPRFTAKNSKPAFLAFNGDVYGGLDACSLHLEDLEWAQSRVLMLSGLYGALRPLDWMQAYRLEMGTRLSNDHGSNLYKFWGDKLAKHINSVVADQKSPTVVNLASQEYFKAVDQSTLKARVIEIVFEEYKNGQYKIISFLAKRARGLMTRYVIDHRIENENELKGFDLEGYQFSARASNVDRWIFRRKV